MKRIDVWKCTLVKERSHLQDYVCGDSGDVAMLFNSMVAGACEEYCYMFALNNKGRIVGVHEISHGDISSSIVSPREIFKRALLNNATSIIIAHNHLTGDCTPSECDKTITQRISKCGEMLGIPLLDHVIVGDGDYTSMKQAGYIS